MEVTVVSKKLVKPTCPTPEKLRNLQISSLDQLAFPLYVRVILYYTGNDGGASSDQRKRRLEESLASVLSLYYPLAGRYMSDKYMIDCNDQGAELLEAKVNCELSQLLLRKRGNNIIDVQELKCLLPTGIESPTTPLLIIQLNVFDCGGIAIGFTSTHRIMDGVSQSEFLRGWSIACSQGIDKVHRPSFQVAYSLLPPRDRLPVINYGLRIKEGVSIVTKRFLFDEEAITTLKAIASSDVTDKFSRGQVVTALIWMALTRTCQAKNNGNLRSSLLTQPANMRDKLVRIPIPPNSCCNFVIHSIAKFASADDKINLDFAEMVRLLRDSVTSTFDKCAELTSGDDIFAGVIDSWNERVCGDDVDVYKFTSWCNLPYYEADFGWGKPVWISSTQIPRDKFTMLLDTKDKKGVEAWVSLDENDMPLFQENLQIALTIT